MNALLQKKLRLDDADAVEAGAVFEESTAPPADRIQKITKTIKVDEPVEVDSTFSENPLPYFEVQHRGFAPIGHQICPG